METFDAPALQTSCARRESSTHAPQALELLNGRSRTTWPPRLPTRLRSANAATTRANRRSAAFRLAARPRADRTRTRICRSTFLREQPLGEFALAMFNLNEFLYVP